MKTEKKSERIEIRVGFEEKASFVDACDNQGDTPSGALRRFIRGYVRRADGDMVSDANRRLFRRYGRFAAAALLGGVGVVATLAILSGSEPALTDEQVFAARDVDGNGALSLIEHKLLDNPDGSPNAVMRVLDLDASGTLSSAEFRASGRMVFVHNSDDDTVIGREGEPFPMTMVEFAFTPERTRHSTYAGATVNAGDLDRAVIWYDDGTNSVFEGEVAILTSRDGEIKFISDIATFPASVAVEDGDDNAVTARRGQKETAPEGGR